MCVFTSERAHDLCIDDWRFLVLFDVSQGSV